MTIFSRAYRGHTFLYFRSTPSEFNDSTKNEERRTDARYELQRNFKGDDSPGGTDLSARLSFAKRVREVKAASEAAVFKEDYPCDDKSIEDDKRPNRSRMFELSEAYRKPILDVEKFKKEIDKISNRDMKNFGDVRTSCFVDEKLRKPNACQHKVISNAHRNYSLGPVRNASTAKMKKKRISRSVQYDVPIVRHSRVSQFFLNCFRSKSDEIEVKKYNLAHKIEKEKTLDDDKKKFDIELQEEINKSLDTIRFSHKSHDVEMEKLMNNTDVKREIFKNQGNKMKKITDTNDNEKQNENDSLKNCKVKISFLEKLNKILNRNNNNPKAQQNELDFSIVDDSQYNEKGIDKSCFENNRINDGWGVKIVDRKRDSNNACKIAITNSDRENDVNEVKKRLDLCITELNDIISDACVIFGGGKNSAPKSS